MLSKLCLIHFSTLVFFACHFSCGTRWLQRLALMPRACVLRGGLVHTHTQRQDNIAHLRVRVLAPFCPGDQRSRLAFVRKHAENSKCVFAFVTAPHCVCCPCLCCMGLTSGQPFPSCTVSRLLLGLFYLSPCFPISRALYGQDCHGRRAQGQPIAGGLPAGGRQHRVRGDGHASEAGECANTLVVCVLCVAISVCV